MGLGMARSLRRAGLPVVGVDLRAERREALGDPVHASAQEAVEGADLLILVVVNAAQVESLLIGSEGFVEGLAPGAIVMVSSTVPTSYVREQGRTRADRVLLYLVTHHTGVEKYT